MVFFYLSPTLFFVLFSRVSCTNLVFPNGFMLGVGTGNPQIEGAWNVSAVLSRLEQAPVTSPNEFCGPDSQPEWLTDKAVSINDYWAHETPYFIEDRSNGDIAADSYHKYKEDVQLVKNLGLDVYRYSISWARLLPNGYVNEISADGLAYYKNLTQALVDNGIKPMVTLHHMDHPQNIEDMGGFTNSLIIDLFAKYARVVFEEIGPLVDTFITINQPNILCGLGYKDTPPETIAPGKKLGNYGQYICMHNALKAHAKVWHMYDKEYRPTQKGKIGINVACSAYQPLDSTSMDDLVAAEYGFEFNCGWIWNPIYLGDYPEIMRTRIDEFSSLEGYPRSRLPRFTSKEIDYILGTSDFCAFNYYFVRTATFNKKEDAAVSPEDSGVIEAKINDADIVAAHLPSLLTRIRDRYSNPPILITENGIDSKLNVIDDYDRIYYFNRVLTSILSAIYDEGVNVVGYLVWTLLDCWEWNLGYTKTYGLYAVDFNSANRTRRAKLSVSWLKSVVATRELQPVLTPYEQR